MRISLVQSALQWEQAEANRRMFSDKLAPLRGQTDLVLLPEMFTTGFSMEALRLAEPPEGPTLQWIRETSAALGAAVAGSFICLENDSCYNRLVFMRPDGHFDIYNKKHLFSLAGEDKHFATNNKKLVLEWKGFRIMPLVCYDLRFPVWSRNNPGEPYDILLYVANWPSRRSHHWRTLLPARAIENQSFVAGVNIVGTDGNGLEYSGDSAVYDFTGNKLFEISGVEGIQTAELSLENLLQFRQQLPFLQDADPFTLQD